MTTRLGTVRTAARTGRRRTWLAVEAVMVLTAALLVGAVVWVLITPEVPTDPGVSPTTTRVAAAVMLAASVALSVWLAAVAHRRRQRLRA